MGYSNSAVAYDLSTYEAAPKKKQSPQLKVVGKAAPRRKLTTLINPRTVGTFAIVVTLISLIVYNQVRLAEITGEMNALNNEILRLESEYTRTKTELDSQISRQAVEEIAKEELGLDAVSAYQTQWVNLYQEDKIERGVLAPDPTATTKIRVAIGSFIDSIKEYIQGD